MLYKKQIAILLSFLLLVSNVGLVLDAVFCGEKLIAIYTSSVSDDNCHIIKKEITSCCDIVIENENCCATKTIDIKPTVNQLALLDLKLSFDSYPVYISTDIFYFSILHKIAFIKQTYIFVFNSNAPPLYKLLCRFVTYG